jgi:hypothetical protein
LAYTIFEKQRPSKSTSPTVTISPLGRCALNRAAAEMLSKDAVENVLLLWDQDNFKFAIKPVGKKDHRSFPIRFTLKDDEKTVIGGAFSGIMFLNFIKYDRSKTGTYPIVRGTDGGMYEVQLPEERFRGHSEHQQPLVAVEGGKKHGKTAVGA